MEIYSAFKLTKDNDRAIENGAFVLIHDKDVIKQQIKINLKLLKKDWFLNYDEGILYFDNQAGIIGAKELTTVQGGQIQAAAENTIGVVVLESYDFDIEGTELVVNIVALTEFGKIKIENFGIGL